LKRFTLSTPGRGGGQFIYGTSAEQRRAESPAALEEVFDVFLWKAMRSIVYVSFAKAQTRSD